MARRATKDTIAFEPVGVVPGDDTVVRREVKAGWDIPDHYQLEDDGAAEEYDRSMTAGLGAAPAAYKHQLDDDGLVAEEHSEGTGEEDEAGNRVLRRPAARGHARGRKASKASGDPFESQPVQPSGDQPVSESRKPSKS